jgi:hypothetical protein
MKKCGCEVFSHGIKLLGVNHGSHTSNYRQLWSVVEADILDIILKMPRLVNNPLKSKHPNVYTV